MLKEKNDKLDILQEEERFGYQSGHYLVKLKANRIALSEYSRFEGLIVEIEVKDNFTSCFGWKLSMISNIRLWILFQRIFIVALSG
jgi:hypothetical protein